MLAVNASGEIRSIAIPGEVVSTSGETLGTVRSTPFYAEPAFNSRGQATFEASVVTQGGARTDAIFLVQANGQRVEVVREGQAGPGGVGRFSSLGRVPIGLSDRGDVVFGGTLADDNGIDPNTSGVFRFRPGGTLDRVVMIGDPAPDGGGVFEDYGFPSVNDRGTVAFTGLTSAAPGGRQAGGVFLARADGAIERVVASGQVPPGSAVAFDSFNTPTPNNHDEVAFIAGLGSRSTPAFLWGHGLYRSDRTGGLVEIARSGQAAPDGNGVFTILDGADINDAGQTVFAAFLNVGASTGGYGVFLSDPASGLTTVARLNPGSSGLREAERPDINEAGQVAFQVGPPPFTELGITATVYFYDNAAGLVTVAEVGDEFLGSTLTSVSFAQGARAYGDERSGLNDAGQVAFSFSLADGRQGVAVWSAVPEPSTAFIALAVAITRARRLPTRR